MVDFTKTKPIGIRGMAKIIGVRPITIRRRMDPKSKYYDPRMAKPRKNGNTYTWYEYEADMYLEEILGPPLVPDDE